VIKDGKLDKKTKKKIKSDARLQAWIIRLSKTWLSDWCTSNFDQLKKLESGWITIHPEHGLICHSAISEEDLVNRCHLLIKRSVLKSCTGITVEEEIKKAQIKEVDIVGGARWTTLQLQRDDNLPPLANVDDELPLYEPLSDTTARFTEKTPYTVKTLAAKHSIHEAKVLTKLKDLGAEGIWGFNTIIDDELVNKFEQSLENNSDVPESAKTSPHKQPDYKPVSRNRSLPYDRDLVVDGYGRSQRLNKMRMD